MNSTIDNKYLKFINEPFAAKLVDELPGITSENAVRLTAAGFPMAFCIVGQYFLLQKNEENFIKWLEEVCSADANNARTCYNSIRAWFDMHTFYLAELLTIFRDCKTIETLLRRQAGNTD